MSHASLERPPSHFCGIVVFRDSPTVLGEVEFLVIDYEKGGPKQIKFAGGTSKGEEQPFRDMIPTLRRETAFELSEPSLPSGHQVVIKLSDEALASRLVALVKKSPNHTQYFYMVAEDELGGILRQQAIWDDEERKEEGLLEKLGPPYFATGKELFRSIFPSHFVALVATIKKLSEISEGVKSFHSDTLHSVRTRDALAKLASM